MYPELSIHINIVELSTAICHLLSIALEQMIAWLNHNFINTAYWDVFYIRLKVCWHHLLISKSGYL